MEHDGLGVDVVLDLGDLTQADVLGVHILAVRCLMTDWTRCRVWAWPGTAHVE